VTGRLHHHLVVALSVIAADSHWRLLLNVSFGAAGVLGVAQLVRAMLVVRLPCGLFHSLMTVSLHVLVEILLRKEALGRLVLAGDES